MRFIYQWLHVRSNRRLQHGCPGHPVERPNTTAQTTPLPATVGADRSGAYVVSQVAPALKLPFELVWLGSVDDKMSSQSLSAPALRFETHPKSNCILQFKTNTKHHHVEKHMLQHQHTIPSCKRFHVLCVLFSLCFRTFLFRNQQKTPRPRLRLRFTDLARRLSPTLDTNRYTSRARPRWPPRAPRTMNKNFMAQWIHCAVIATCGTSAPATAASG